MEKGFAVTTAIELFIAAIILFIFAPMLLKSANAVFTTIMSALGIIKPSDVEQAAFCSYYRCTEGCRDTRVAEEIKWKNGDKTVSCQDFCQLPPEWDCTNNLEKCYTDTKKLTLCGSKAWQFPVKISLSDEYAINSKILNDAAGCIVSSDSTPSTIPLALTGEKFLFIDKSLLKDVKTTNVCGNNNGLGIKNAIESANIKKDSKKTVYIYTSEGPCPIQSCSFGPGNLVTKIVETIKEVCFNNPDCCIGNEGKWVLCVRWPYNACEFCTEEHSAGCYKCP